MIFGRGHARALISGPMRAAGRVFAEPHRRAAMPSARSCQAENADGTPPARAIISLNALATFVSKSASIW